MQREFDEADLRDAEAAIRRVQRVADESGDPAVADLINRALRPNSYEGGSGMPREFDHMDADDAEVKRQGDSSPDEDGER